MKQNVEEYKGDSKGSENVNENLDSGCESDVSSRVTKKKFPMFKLQKDMVDFK